MIKTLIRLFLIVAWTLAFTVFGGVLLGIASALIYHDHIPMSERSFVGIPADGFGYAFALLGLLLGIYGKLPGTRKIPN